MAFGEPVSACPEVLVSKKKEIKKEEPGLKGSEENTLRAFVAMEVVVALKVESH